MSNQLPRYTPSCTVVVCTRERPHALNECLEALSALDYPCFEVLVVDNGSRHDATAEIAARWGARYVMEREVGLSRARNRGARLCNTEVVAFLDDDAVPERDWLARLMGEFCDPLVMVATGRVLPLNDSSRLEHPCTALTSGGALPRRVVDRNTPAWFEMANFGGLGDGGSMAFRRAAFDVCPGFDERLGRGAALDASEEHYAFFQLLDRGYRAVFTPEAVAHHPVPRTPGDLRTRSLRDLTASTAYFALLLVEQPRYRWRVVRYLLEAALGTRRPWREANGMERWTVPLWPALRACVQGPLLYARSRVFDRRAKHVPPQRGVRLEPSPVLVGSGTSLSSSGPRTIQESRLQRPGLPAQ